MTGFKITTQEGNEIRFSFLIDEAFITYAPFKRILPFTRTFNSARISGQKIWIEDAPQVDIIQENSSVFTEPGEVVFGRSKPIRTKTAYCFGIY